MFEIDKGTDDCCFLCGAKLDRTSGSDEHVFPKWLLREANLWNQTAYQLNASLLPYRQCVIPCCVPCNSGPLSALESEVQEAFADGAAGVAGLDPARLSLWMAKIDYGILRRSHSLRADRKDPLSHPIVTAKAMQSLSMLHMFLQRIRLDHQFGFDPDSTFVCNVHSYGDPERDFDWIAATVVGKPGKERFVPALALRHNGVGVISLFGDAGALKIFGRAPFDEFADVRLHHVQFFELACRAFYQHSLLTDRIAYWSGPVEGGPMMTVAHLPSEGPLWNEWDQEEYAMYFFRHLKERSHPGIADLSDVYFGGDAVISFLYAADRTRRVATAEELL